MEHLSVPFQDIVFGHGTAPPVRRCLSDAAQETKLPRFDLGRFGEEVDQQERNRFVLFKHHSCVPSSAEFEARSNRDEGQQSIEEEAGAEAKARHRALWPPAEGACRRG
jgi:hypothetical protein